jgi:CRP-like cAMP-binding protein
MRLEVFGLRADRAMSKATQRQDLSALSAAKRGLVYLTPNDWTLIADKATRTEFQAGDVIVQKGKPTNGVYLLLSGSATVQIHSPGTVLALGPGEVCGEISLLDELPATTSVVAQQPLEALYLDRPTLLSLFELFPHLGSRFYHSLACGLARRLRELIAVETPPANE